MGVVLDSPTGVKFNKKVQFLFSDALVTRPLIYEMAQRYDVIPNIEKARVGTEGGWVIVGINGTVSEMDEAFKWMADQGVVVQMMLEGIPN